MSTINIAMPKALEIWEIDRLIPYKNNARVHSPEQVEVIVQSMIEYGFMQPILVDEKSRTIIAGHGRLQAAKKLRLTRVPVTISDHLSPEQIRGYIIMDNKSAEMATWDDAMLKIEFTELRDLGFGLEKTGFAESEWGAFFPEADPDEIEGQDIVEAAPAIPVTQPGDLWQIGMHRLICADCHDAIAVVRALNDRQIQLVMTSPPYASQRKYDETSPFKPIAPDQYLAWFSDVAARIRSHIADGGSYFLNIKEHAEGGQRHLYVKELVITHVRKWGWRFVDEFCWRNTAEGVPGRWNNRFKNAWEPVFHFSAGEQIKLRHERVMHASENAFSSKGGKQFGVSTASGLLGTHGDALGPGRALPSNVIETRAEMNNNGHPAPFPVALPEFFVKAFTDPGDVVYEPFCGSGTTMVAANKHARVCAGVEISPNYCDMVILRMKRLFPEIEVILETQDGTGREHGMSFEQAASARGVEIPNVEDRKKNLPRGVNAMPGHKVNA